MNHVIEQVFSFVFYAIHLPPAEEGEFLLYYVKLPLNQDRIQQTWKSLIKIETISGLYTYFSFPLELQVNFKVIFIVLIALLSTYFFAVIIPIAEAPDA